MTTLIAEKIYKEIKELKRETKNLKEIFFMVLRDTEGEYKNSFVKKILRNSRSKPVFSFDNKNDFLKQIS